ncbi:MAG: TonB-dependent receptor plug domain-containing protein [Pseudobdellovibrio sp.]
MRFGSDAIGGVINIITTRGTEPAKTTIELEAGSYNTIKSRIATSGKHQNIDYSIGLSHSYSGGFSAADTGNSNAEADSSQRTTLSSHVGYEISADTNLQFSLRANQLLADLDVNGGPGSDDPNYTSNSQQLQMGAQYNSTALNKSLLYSLGLGTSYVTRSDDNPPDPLQPTTDSTDYFAGHSYQFDSRNEYVYSNHVSFLFGAKYNTETGHSESNYNGSQTDFTEHDNLAIGVYGIHQYHGETFSSELGLRRDQRTNYGGITNAQAKISYPPAADTLLQVEYGTGFKNPSLYQLYSSYGNENLQDEKSSTASVAFEKTWSKTFFFSADYFVNEYSDLIDFDSVTSKYYNIARASSNGAEFEIKWQISSDFAIKSSLTQLQTENKLTGAKLARRPDTTAMLELLYSHEHWKASVQYNYVGPRNDIDPTLFTPITMPSYDVVNAEVSYTADHGWSYSGRVVNLFDRKYQSVAGYSTSALAGYVGVTKDFE